MQDDTFGSLEDKLYRTRYETSTQTHITVDAKLCRKCSERGCTKICPATVYKDDPNDKAAIAVSHENCLECGTCLQICPASAIDWKMPDGGMGVSYRYG